MKKNKLSADDVATLILFSAIIFGTWLRLFPVWLAGFPINDGGMFYTMIQDLQANQYSLPLFTSYNHLNIPYVYPPLGFYLGAIVIDLFGFSSPLPVLQWLPGILNSLCIPAFYLLTKEISGNKLQSAISTLVFSFIPHMTAWFSMGGGLTRSLGALFMLLALRYIYRVFSQESRSDILGAIIFSSLAILSHTEAPIYTAAIAIYIWAIKSHSLKGLANGILISTGVLICTLPWTGWIYTNHGFAPFISAAQTGLHSTWSFLKLLNIDLITEEPYLDLLGAIGILGMALLAARKDFLLPGMFAVIFLSHPRSAHTVSNIPLAMAAGALITEIFSALISRTTVQEEKQTSTHVKYSLPIFLFVILPYLISNSLNYGNQLAQKRIPETDKDAMQWIVQNTPLESTFLIITGEPNGFCDSVSEWFPTLTYRTSLTTLQGNEWLLGSDFVSFAGRIQSLQSCNSLECISTESKNFSSDFDYLYISLASPTVNCELLNASLSAQNLIQELENSPHFELIYERPEETIILAKK